MFNEAIFEHQEIWKAFNISPIPKRIRRLDAIHETMKGSLYEELASVRESLMDTSVFAYLRAGLINYHPELWFLREAVSVQRKNKRNQIKVCDKCFGFHASRTCARTKKCETYGVDTHDDKFQSESRCLNCRGLHSIYDLSRPTKSRHSNGILKWPMGMQLQHRALGEKVYAKLKN
ncbi:hypothetical protein EPUL_004352 [Erysiphe pulchra]|uniref:Uncharacterized protein n=1 Tax=Erysiphe pulchra TaxID=225359 RepID=A0A2S4PR65_9PEZI|nr:hypothetical protein EPUL_004352 [Erysiphe pulchra]